jgi:hypothetical protein
VIGVGDGEEEEDNTDSHVPVFSATPMLLVQLGKGRQPDEQEVKCFLYSEDMITMSERA